MEPEQLMFFAKRNGIKVPYKSVKEAKEAYVFSDLASFLDVYIQATQVLCTEQDFYDLTYAYLKKASEQGVVHAEIFFDLQNYMPRNIGPDIIVNGIHRALTDAYQNFGISGGMIMCFIRHLSQEDAFKALELSLPFKDKIVGVGLASLEAGHPPSKFEQVFEKARSYGYRVVAHEGECSAKGLQEAVELINVDRLDDGIQIMGNADLVQKSAHKKTPFTVCPLSNKALNIIDDLKNHPLKDMMKAGLVVTINSDDPAFFGGYIAENYYAAIKDINLSLDDIIMCAYNSIHASFADEQRKQKCYKLLHNYVKNNNLLNPQMEALLINA